MLKSFLISSTFMICFGLVDNLGLWLGFSAIENYIQSLGFSPLLTAMLGNTFSDQLGVLLGGTISAILHKILNTSEEKASLIAQLFGITVGCLLPTLFLLK